MAEYTQLALFDPFEEAANYHYCARTGHFAILYADGDSKRQRSYKLTDMAKVLGMVDTSRDTWLSQAEFFKPNRRVVNLARIGLLFADLDTYYQPWAKGRTPEQLAQSVLWHCHQEGIPTPSILVFSGRGIQAKWLMDGALPRGALPRWNACQRHLVDRLAHIGADPAAKDASRVLRLVNTVNSKSGEVCRVVHVENGLDGQPIRYSFEYLAEILLPVARWDIEKQRKERIERKQLKLVSGGRSSNLRGFSGGQLAWHRMEDLRFLGELRGGVKEGDRMLHLFWRLNFLLQSGATNSVQMYHEAAALAREIDPSWSYGSKELMTLYSKARQHQNGVKIEFGGKKYSPLYTPRNDTLINLFQITDNEQRALRTLISKDMAKERDRERDTARRRAAGAVDRETYVESTKAKSTAKQAQALALKAQGLSVRAIAAQMGISKSAVSRYIAES